MEDLPNEAVVSHFEVLSWQFSGVNEDTTKTSHSFRCRYLIPEALGDDAIPTDRNVH
jgi:hypothetical protein